MKLTEAQHNLVELVKMQMAGYVVLEIIVGLLIAAGMIPPLLDTAIAGGIVVKINTAFIMIGALLAVLVSAFWSAVLVEYGFFELKSLVKKKR
jgi:hypothetical protein